jgi:hypothetical protein
MAGVTLGLYTHKISLKSAGGITRYFGPDIFCGHKTDKEPGFLPRNRP